MKMIGAYGAHHLPGSDLVAIHDDNIVGFEYEDEE